LTQQKVFTTKNSQFAHGANVKKTAARVARSNRAVAAKAMLSMSSGPATTEGYGAHCFKGAVADQYLSKYGESASLIANGDWTKSPAKADVVAKAVLDWAVDNGASVYCHWFQPMGSSGVRHGNTGQVHQSMLDFAADGTPSYKFSGEQLLQGETDGSSYPNGGMRATHTAGGYLSIDPYSPIFLREDTVFIPAAFVSYNGDALDEKTPLHRATDALNKETKRMLKALGYTVKGNAFANIGLEQEIFLVPRNAYYRRPDLQFTGRTITGAMPARGQEMCDHYMAPISRATAAFECMRQIQQECFKVGIPLKTRHREVAPNQYEFAPLFGNAITQVDQNLMIMQIIEEVASEHGLAALLQEKPFAGINGSGKHNNWSIGTSEGLNLMNPKQVAAVTGSNEAFPLIMAAIVSAVDKHGDLMRLAIASPGNDFRLGAMEAPPAVISTYLGSSITDYFAQVKAGTAGAYVSTKKELNFGTDTIPHISVPAEDRNRTSPFPYGGNRFEFRAAGSSQNVAMVNTVLNTISAEAFKIVADRLEKGEKPLAITKDLLEKHEKVIFNGNGYDPEWPEEAVKRGIWRIDAGCDAIAKMTDEKNVKLFGEMGIFNEKECVARREVMLNHYIGTVEMEALCLIDMINQHIIPSVKKADLGNPNKLVDATKTLKGTIAKIHAEEDKHAAANIARDMRLETMVSIRGVIDEFEKRCPPEDWTLATYKELLFLDTHDHTEYM
jgi:glutamine synthetase